MIGSVARGASKSWPYQVFKPDLITPSTAFLDTDVLAATLWRGDDQSVVAILRAIWVDATVAKWQLLYLPEDTAGAAIEAGVYTVRVTSRRATDTVELLRDSLEIQAVPSAAIPASVTATIANGVVTGFVVVSGGAEYAASSTTIPVTMVGGGGYGAAALATSDVNGVITAVAITRGGAGYSTAPAVAIGAAPLPVYGSYEDMASECNWIQQFQDTDEDQTGFREQRGRAREWMDSLILRAAPVSGAGALISRQSWWSWANSGVDPRSGTGLAIDTVLAGYLASDYLVTTGPNGAGVRRACSCYAIALVLRAQPGTEQVQQAGYFMRRAQAEAASLVCEVDIGGTGRSQYAIALSCTNTRFG